MSPVHIRNRYQVIIYTTESFESSVTYCFAHFRDEKVGVEPGYVILLGSVTSLYGER